MRVSTQHVVHTPARKTIDYNFLLSAKGILSLNDFDLLSNMVEEWHAAQTLSSCLSLWSPVTRKDSHASRSFLYTLCFNVRGFDARWSEVHSLSTKHQFDILVLGEVGKVDFSLLGALYSSYQSFYQAGENAHGGVIILIRQNIPVSRFPCSLPNVCIIDLHLDVPSRLVGIYAPASKSWSWNDLSRFTTASCAIMGDFNVDLEEDGGRADSLLCWADSCGLAPFVPDTHTSLRSNRTIDYSFASGIEISVQTYEGPTTSDHKPILCVLGCERRETCMASRTIWSVFSLFLSYTYAFWEHQWASCHYDITYDVFIDFLVALAGRCTTVFPLKMARTAIPPELKILLAHSRSLAFKAKRKGSVILREEARHLRNVARSNLKRFQQEQLAQKLADRHQPGKGSVLFWSRTKRHFRTASSSLRGLISPDGESIKDPQNMANLAADYYEQLFEEPTVMRPHPYVDTPAPEFDNWSDRIPLVSYPEILKVLVGREKKRSCDSHGLSPFLLGNIPKHYWHFFVRLYNHSFSTCFLPKRSKDVRMILLAKKSAVCTPDQTRPISLLDSFLKVQERLFLNRFIQVLKDRGILPDNQSGFRAGHRLQTRVLLLIEQISSYMSNSSPVATVFVDFKSAFDQLWFEGCLGKLIQMSIPKAFVNWIRAWLEGRRATIEIQGKRSRWFPIRRGGPQGSSLTPSLFITYHADMGDFLPMAMSFFFADDLAAVVAGQMGIKYTEQCIDLERRLHSFFAHLEYYSILAVQPINYAKTQVMWSARAVEYPNPMPKLHCGGHSIEWVNSYKYLGYLITTKLGWGQGISNTQMKIRQQTAMINSIRFGGSTSPTLRRVLFSTFVLPFFTWLYALYPLFTDLQRANLTHFYYTSLKRVYHCQYWNDLFFAFAYGERSLDDLCYAYWRKYLKRLAKSLDGYLFLEQSCLNANRSEWQERRRSIRFLYRSKRFVPHVDVLGHTLDWLSNHGSSDSIAIINVEDIRCFAEFPESF